MQLTKHAHACVTLTARGQSVVIDPGSLTPHAEQAVAGASAVLVTHEHFDHFDATLLTAALAQRPELQVFGPPSIGAALAERAEQFRPVGAGDVVRIAGFTVAVHGDRHATIHPDIPPVDNVGYLVDGCLYHPGDAYHVPDASVGTLLLPVSGPWTKFGEAADYVRAVAPERSVAIHELMLSELGQQSAAAMLGVDGLTGRTFLRLAVGEQLDV